MRPKSSSLNKERVNLTGKVTKFTAKSFIIMSNFHVEGLPRRNVIVRENLLGNIKCLFLTHEYMFLQVLAHFRLLVHISEVKDDSGTTGDGIVIMCSQSIIGSASN